MQIDKIIYPVDFTLSLDQTEKMVLAAKDLARTFDAHLVVLFIAHDFKHHAGFYVPHTSLDVLEKEAESGAHTRMDRFRREYFEDFENVSFEVRVGDVVEEIVKAAEEEGAGLVLMGTHGRRGMERTLFGSVTELVVRTCKVPVLSVKLN